MATYYHHQGSEIQAPDGLQTLVLMNPSYVQYSSTDAPPQPPTSNLVFLNSPGAGTLSHHHAHQAPPSHTQQFVGIPLSAASQDPGSHPVHVAQDISPFHGLLPRVQYNLWNHPAGMDPSGRETPRSSQQGLSLSLSSQNPGSFRSFNRTDTQPLQGPASGGGSPSSASGVTNGVSGIQSVLLSSKYLKAAQELLEEVVNVGNGMKLDSPTKKSDNHNRPNKAAAGESSSSATPQPKEEGSSKSSAELSTAERQEIQMKKAKLISMLDEVEQRYRQYHNQMQIVISSFEQAAGIGSAKTYTALALQTISKQFRCLKDAIAGQIRAANKSLGEEESPAGKIEGSRLKFVDHHLRQQRALQQLGVMQHNAWRPQRGLPERSVSILRAWLFEHFLHPYPKDSDKHMLAKQTGLTRSQVSNWFINARVRLWKPMVEEMYTEEMKEHEKNNGTDEKTSKSTENNEDSTSKSSPPPPESNTNMSFNLSKEINSLNYDTPAISTSELDGITLVSPKKPRSSSDMMASTNVPSMDHDQQNREGYSIMGGPANFIGGFGQYPMGEIGRFGAEQFNPFGGNNGVSLTLGLPHTENLSLSIDHHHHHHHQGFLPNQNMQLGRRVEVGDHQGNEFGAINAPIPQHSSNTYENINMQNRKRLLLPDFVA